MPGAAVASLLVGVTIALEFLVLHGANGDKDVRAAAITVLGTVVTFFAVSTLAVSVSLTLLQTAEHMWPARVMKIFTDDHDRAILLQTICAAFLVSLVNLTLLTAGLVHPLLALAVPVLAAFLTLMLMIAYVFDRVRLFSSEGLIDEITRRFKDQIKLLVDGPDPRTARIQALEGVSDIFEVASALITKDRRLEDAREAIRQGFSLAKELMQAVQTSPRLQAPDTRRSDPDTGWPDQDPWVDALCTTIMDRGRRACVQLDDIVGNSDGIRTYDNWFESVFSRLSGIALVNLGTMYLYTKNFRLIESREAVASEMSILATLANALSSDSTITSPLIGQEKDLLERVAREACSLLAKRRTLCAANGEVSPDNAVAVLGNTFTNYSPAVLALAPFADFAALLDEWKASLSAEQSSALTRWERNIAAKRNREAAA